MTFLPFIIRRARRHWQLLLTLSLGVVLATALLASGPLLVDAVIQMGLDRTLQTAKPQEAHLRLAVHTQVNQATYAQLDAQVTALLQRRLEDYLKRIVRSRRSNWMFPWVNGQLVTEQRVSLADYEGIRDQVQIIAGDWPGEGPVDAQAVPVVVADEMARLYTLRVGDLLPLNQRQSDAEPAIQLRVAGIVRPTDYQDPYWFGEFSPLTSQTSRRWAAQYSAILPAERFFPDATALSRAAGFDLEWRVLLSQNRISSRDIPALQAQLVRLAGDLRRLDTRILLESELGDILADFTAQAKTIRAPLYVLIAEVVLLVLYYVTMVAALSMRVVEREFAVVRSRGASGWQLLKIQVTEAGLVATAALLSGPMLGVTLVNGLAWVGPLADLGQSSWAFTPTQGAWLAASIGTLACLASLLLPLGPALQRGIVKHQQSTARATNRPWWQRYYLDVFLLLGGLILLWRLHLYGDLVVGGVNQPRLDWLLLLSPLALLMGSATILLRLFPLLLTGMAAIASRSRGLSGVLALWQAARDPTHVARLVLLFTLAIALGILSTGLNATLDQSESERAQYLAGQDVRLVAARAIPVRDLESAPGVLNVAGAWRGEGTVNLKSSRALPRFEVLAIEPYSFAEVTTYREDYADQYMGELLGYLVVDERQGPPMLTLPGRPARLGLWVRARVSDKDLGAARQYVDGDSDLERIGLEAKLLTASGELFTVRLQSRLPLFDDEWGYFDTSLPVLPTSSYPLSLFSLWVQNRARQFNQPMSGVNMQLALDDLTILDGDTGELKLAEGFEDPTRIWYFRSSSANARFTRSEPRSGTATLDLDIQFTRPLEAKSLMLTAGQASSRLPALVSPAFLETTQLTVGDVVHTWIDSIDVGFEIVGTVRYFPTLYEEAPAGFLITSRDGLLPLLNETSRNATNLNEALLETDQQTSAQRLLPLVSDLDQSWEAETVRKSLKANPLALGLRGVTFFGYTLTAVLSLVGFATHFYLSTRQRETLYGVLRAIGLSARQLYVSVVVEQVILILLGLGLGTVLGALLNQITLPRLPITLGTEQPIPPFYPTEDWLAVARVYLVLAGAVLISLGVATVMLWRARLHRILRIGQE